MKNLSGKKINYGKERIITILGISTTLAAFVVFAFDISRSFVGDFGGGNIGSGAEKAAFFVIILFLIYGNLIYQFTRIGYIARVKNHKRIKNNDLKEFVSAKKLPSIAVLIPSYKEELKTVKMTVLSAALQNYPEKEVILLIDDPPTFKNREDSDRLHKTVDFIVELNKEFENMARFFRGRLGQFEKRRKIRLQSKNEYLRIEESYGNAISYIQSKGGELPGDDNTEKFFIANIINEATGRYASRLEEFSKLMRERKGKLSAKIIREEYLFLADSFAAKIKSFERRRYENLSHEANKAMNLNSYIGLMGKRLSKIKKGGRYHLIEAKSYKKGDLYIPDAEYIITLDADSIILPDYASRLMYFMCKPKNVKIAVAQTPYNAFPDSPSTLERMAGATTDIQHLIHQGFTYFGATFWVGANALLRKSALMDIVEKDEERGYPIFRYIQDRTAIEDTESSIDLIKKGWALHNYPERLAYSATPSDFGSLLIQRRRWANGGLIIFPKLVGYAFKRGPGKLKRLVESIVRAHYLTSIAGVNIGLLAVILYRFEDGTYVFWVIISSLPYYFMYGRDLSRIGYGIKDLPRIYALNMMLILINLGGVFKSINQIITRKKIPFSRTPKVPGRTGAPAFYVMGEMLMLLYSIFAFGIDLVYGNWGHAAFSLVNFFTFLYIFVVYMKVQGSFCDISFAFASTFRRVLPRGRRQMS